MDSPADGAFVAGLIAGDGSFGIRPNNSGASWACGLQVNARNDDTPLLARLCRWSEVGRLRAVPACGGSRPQTLWQVGRQADCLRLVRILDRYPLLGKKAGEFDIWRRAVLAWTAVEPGGKEVVADCAARLLAHRRFEYAPPITGVDISTPYLLGFLAGFASAEAHFGARTNGHPSFVINLRRDDGAILRLMRDRLELGHIADIAPRGTSRAALSWRIGKLHQLRTLVALLDQQPPRGRVFRTYRAWRRLVLTDPSLKIVRRELAVEVRRRRAYKPGLGTIVPLDRRADRRARYLAVLRAWRTVHEAPFTTTMYEQWRRDSTPAAPKRDTIARAFGSWLEALKAAGLSTDGCRSEELNRRAQEPQEAARQALKAQQTAAILKGVARCAQMLGHLPSAAEFFAWRNEFEPQVPSHMTVYRHFPGGWRTVLAALPRGST